MSRINHKNGKKQTDKITIMTNRYTGRKSDKSAMQKLFFDLQDDD